ncbi:MAG TPA: PAS domain S-box protein [Desulfuromonadales bacterium]|nr:PAS domain S-box protein [Desulfuromonadales bacterium]
MAGERRLRIFINARIIVSFLFLVSTLLLKYQNAPIDFGRFQSGVIRLMLFSCVFSIASLCALKLKRFTNFLTYLQVIWDLLFVTVLLLFTGGILSPYSFLYLLSIMVSGMLLGQREALYTASLCGILYGAMLDFQYFGYLGFIGLSQEDAQNVGASRLFYTIFLNFVGFGLTAFITGYLSERARESEAALQQTSVDYHELEQLNTMIVAHSESGLITTTTSGRIRVFNPYAESLVGVSQSVVYDQPIETIFPQLSGWLQLPDDSSAREFCYSTPTGAEMVVGYRVAPFDDGQGHQAGYILNFRDITAIRRMEEALKRADQLAALGEVSARMAHEIRNPLAALSGSVQLLAARGDLVDGDLRLMNIITREADRLNQLITEFLEYARPHTPNREQVNVHSETRDIILLLAADPRFKHISIINVVPPDTVVRVDPGQLRQVMLNLLHNAAEAMTFGGNIQIDAELLTYGEPGSLKTAGVRISVTDNGPGISSEALQHLFEPFWTSKAHGTGLGLAISYRIIEAHGGMLTAETPATGGCRLIIHLPNV